MTAKPQVKVEESARYESRDLTIAFPERATKIDSNGEMIEVTTSYDVKLMSFSREFHEMFEAECNRCGLTMNEREQAMGAMFQELDDIAVMKALKAMIVKR